MKLNRQATICLCVLALTAWGCVPDPLEGFDDMGPTSNNPNSMPGDGGMNNTPDMGGGGGNNFNPQFLQVTAILRPNCMLGGCHGNPAGAAQVFLVPTGQNATDAEIQTALSSTTPTNSGNRLITPGDPNTSEIYVRITKPAGDVQLMGAGTYGGAATPLMQADIDTIGNWITAGATYTQ